MMYGSHSAPFTITVSTTLPGPGLSLMKVGNPAPPRPTIPASRTALRSRLGSTDCQSGRGTRSPHASSPSGSTTTQAARSPEGCGTGRSSMATTRPEVEAWTGTLT